MTAGEQAALDIWTGAEPGEGITADERALAPPAPAVPLAPGQLVRWLDEAGVPHVGRVEGTTEGRVTVTYGPRPHRETLAPFELEAITDKDGEGRAR